MGSLILFLALVAAIARGIQLTWGPGEGEETRVKNQLLAFISLAWMAWASISWFLALLGLLTGPNLLLTATSALLVIATWSHLQGVHPSSWWGIRGIARPHPIDLVPWILLGCLTAFALARGYILPTLNTDALYLSLPKADFYLVDKGLNLFIPPSPEWMGHASQPSTYEMLLASVMALCGNDQLTEWVATLSGVSFVIGCWALFRRWFEERSTADIGIILILSTTVLLLHFSSDKADLTTSLACLLLIHWTTQSSLRPTLWNLGLALLSGLLFIGLKKSGWLVSPVFFIIIFIAALRGKTSRLSPHHVGSLGLLFLAGLLFLGGANHLYLWIHTGNPFGVYAASDSSLLSASTFALTDPLRFLGLVALSPYVSSVQTITIPFTGTEWYWPEYNLFFSHFGPAFIVLFVLALARVTYRLVKRRFLQDQRESTTWALLALLAFALITTHRYSYDGGFNTMARLLLFAIPAVLAMGLLPHLERPFIPINNHRWVGAGLYLSAGLLFSVTAWKAYTKDLHAPLVYALDLWSHPERRRWIFVEPNRLPSRLDRIAGATDTIAADLTGHSWLHPLWGEQASRKLELISWKDGRPLISDEARWVIADNVWGIISGGGLNVQSAADLSKARGKGQVSPRDTLLYRQLLRDPQWRLILASPTGEQCIFQRQTPE